MTTLGIQELYQTYEKTYKMMLELMRIAIKIDDNILITHQTHYCSPIFSIHHYKKQSSTQETFSINGISFIVDMDITTTMDRDSIISFIVNYGTGNETRYCIDDYTKGRTND